MINPQNKAEILTDASALSVLEHAYDERINSVARAKETGKKIIGYFGSDVPQELVMAAGAVPIRLGGAPGQVTELADRYLGLGADSEARAVAELLLKGTYGNLDAVLFTHDSEQPVRLYNMLRELKRVEPQSACKIPDIYLYDLLHMPHRTSAIYNRVRTRQLMNMLGKWTGATFTDDALRAAITLCNVNREMLQEIRKTRYSTEPRLSGTQALKIIGTSLMMPKIEHSELLRQLLTGLGALPIQRGVRVFITGSDHDNPQFYQLVESLGAVIVGEDHDWGDRGYERLVDSTVSDPLDAIVDRYHFCPPAGAKFSIAERAAYTAAGAVAARADVVICFIRHHDEGPRWDCPDQKAALARHNIPYLLIDNQPYTISDEKPLADTISAFLQTARRGEQQ